VQPRANIDEVVDHQDQRWIRLRDQIQRDSLQIGNFTLASGRSSKFLFQLRQTTLHPEGSALLADIIVDYMNAHSIKCIGGLVLGAVPIVSAVSMMSHFRKTPIAAFFVRKEPKEHGAKERIDGFVKKGEDVLLVDDVATSGGSIMKALNGMKEENAICRVHKALVIVDRQEGATENLKAEGIELVSIFKKSDFDIRVK
jgi:orotate phosphoribosyltransferase